MTIITKRVQGGSVRYACEGGWTSDADSAQRFADHTAAHAYLARWSVKLTHSIQIEEN